MTKRETSVRNAELMREFLALNPRMTCHELMERMKKDHNITITDKSCYAQIARCRKGLAIKIPKSRPNPKPHPQHQPNTVADAITALKQAAAVLGGKEATKQVLDAIL